MTTRVDNMWPVIAVSPPRETVLQKEPASRFAPVNRQDTVILDKLLERRVNASWEKGTIVDLYV